MILSSSLTPAPVVLLDLCAEIVGLGTDRVEFEVHEPDGPTALDERRFESAAALSNFARWALAPVFHG